MLMKPRQLTVLRPGFELMALASFRPDSQPEHCERTWVRSSAWLQPNLMLLRIGWIDGLGPSQYPPGPFGSLWPALSRLLRWEGETLAEGIGSMWFSFNLFGFRLLATALVFSDECVATARPKEQDYLPEKKAT